MLATHCAIRVSGYFLHLSMRSEGRSSILIDDHSVRVHVVLRWPSTTNRMSLLLQWLISQATADLVGVKVATLLGPVLGGGRLFACGVLLVVRLSLGRNHSVILLVFLLCFHCCRLLIILLTF